MGYEISKNLNEKCNFPWLLTNVTLINGDRVASTKEYHIEERNGKRIGFIGLGELDWISTLNCLCIDDLDYEDFNLCGERMARFLSN